MLSAFLGPASQSKISVHIPDHIYHAGETIYGIVELNAAEQINTSGVLLQLLVYERTAVDVAKSTVGFNAMSNLATGRIGAGGANGFNAFAMGHNNPSALVQQAPQLNAFPLPPANGGAIMNNPSMQQAMLQQQQQQHQNPGMADHIQSGLGRVEDHFSGMHNHSMTPGMVLVNEKRNLLSFLKLLAGDGKVLTAIQPGVYRWPFAFTLPSHVLSSSATPHGRIEYAINAQYIEPGNINSLMRSQLTSNAYANALDTPPHCRMASNKVAYARARVAGNAYNYSTFVNSGPVTEHKEQSFTFSSGELKVDVTLPRVNLFIGEVIPITVAVANATSKHVDSVIITLQSDYHVEAQGYSKDYQIKEVLRNTFNVKFDEKSTSTQVVQYTVPEVTTSLDPKAEANLVHPCLTTLKYTLIVRLDVAWATDVSVVIPVRIEYAAQQPNTVPIYPTIPNFVFPTDVVPVVLAYDQSIEPTQLQQDLHAHAQEEHAHYHAQLEAGATPVPAPVVA